MQPKILMYSTAVCPYCRQAEGSAAQEGRHRDREGPHRHRPARRDEMMERTGRRTVPQIYIGDYHVGGCDDLFALDHAGKLDVLLRGEAA